MRIKKSILLISIISLGFILVFASGYGKSTNKSYDYEPTITELNGIVKKEIHYGPPNFGESPETDRKEEIYILKLDRPINVRGKLKGDIDTSSYKGITKIQLAGSRKEIKNFINKPVKLKGTLYEHFTINHCTKVLMYVERISSLEKPKVKSESKQKWLRTKQ